MEEDPDKRKAIAARIRALRAKTVENGCTEGEALAAAELAAKLLAQYELSMDEVEMRASPFERAEQTHGDDVGEAFWKVAGAVAELTGTRTWVGRPGEHPVRYTFFGFAHEVEIATYLLEICARAVRSERAAREQEWAFYRAAVRRSRRIGFLDGMCERLAERIRALRPKRPPGTGLVVLRETLIDDEMKLRKLRIKTGHGRDGRDFDPAYKEGREAAETVALDPGIRPPERVAGALSPGSDRD